MKLIKSTITALGLLFTVTACAGNKESKNQNMKGENMEIVHLTKAEFLKKVYNYEANPNDWKYEGDKPAIVDFYADWCGPCKMVAPILDELAKEYDGQIVIYKVDTEKEQELAGRVWYTEYSVHSVHPHGRKAGDGTGGYAQSVI